MTDMLDGSTSRLGSHLAAESGTQHNCSEIAQPLFKWRFCIQPTVLFAPKVEREDC